MLMSKLRQAVARRNQANRDIKHYSAQNKKIKSEQQHYQYVVLLGRNTVLHVTDPEKVRFICVRYDETLHFFDVSEGTYAELATGFDDYMTRYILSNREADKMVKILRKDPLNHPVKMTRVDFIAKYGPKKSSLTQKQLSSAKSATKTKKHSEGLFSLGSSSKND